MYLFLAKNAFLTIENTDYKVTAVHTYNLHNYGQYEIKFIIKISQDIYPNTFL